MYKVYINVVFAELDWIHVDFNKKNNNNWGRISSFSMLQ